MPDIFTSVSGDTVTAGAYLICTAVALVCGVAASAAAAFRSRVTKSFIISLILLPVIVETVIIMVNGNVGTGVAVMGAFSLVRFRSVPGRAKDIVSIFLVMTVGLACAAGYIGIALLVTLLVGAGMVAASFVPIKAERMSDLRITVPETLSFADEFDDLFEKYTKSHTLLSVRTGSMGSLYKLRYRIELRRDEDMKEFIDELRCRNGNLEISITDSELGGEEL